MIKRDMEKKDFEIAAEYAYQLSSRLFEERQEVESLLAVITMRANHSIQKMEVIPVGSCFCLQHDTERKDALASAIRELTQRFDLVMLISEAWTATLEGPNLPRGVEQVEDMENKEEIVLAILHSADQCYSVSFPIDRDNNTLQRAAIDFTINRTGRFAIDRPVH